MTKSEYFANSAKLLLVCSLLLLVSNCLSIFGADGSRMAEISSKLSDISFYVVFFLSFIAFNGEGIGHKRKRDFKRKKVTTFLKIAVLFPFVYRFVKAYVIDFILSNADAGLPHGEHIILGTINMFATYGWLLTVVSVWYLYRDSSTKGLFLLEAVSFLVGMAYSIFKVFSYAIEYVVRYITEYNTTGYEISRLMSLLEGPFGKTDTLNALCIAQYSINVIVFLVASIHYNKIASTEKEEYQLSQKKLEPLLSIYNTDCVGIDTLDDDYGK